MRIVVDAMGSDNAPHPEVQGAVEASLIEDIEIILDLDPNLAAAPSWCPRCDRTGPTCP